MERADTIILIKIFQIENNLNALCLPGTSLFKKHRQNVADIMETLTHRVNVKGIERYASFKYYTIVKSVRFNIFEMLYLGNRKL